MIVRHIVMRRTTTFTDAAVELLRLYDEVQIQLTQIKVHLMSTASFAVLHMTVCQSILLVEDHLFCGTFITTDAHRARAKGQQCVYYRRTILEVCVVCEECLTAPIALRTVQFEAQVRFVVLDPGTDRRRDIELTPLGRTDGQVHVSFVH